LPAWPDLSDEFFRVSRAGWLHIGVGSAASTKILMRVQGPSSDPTDDLLLEAKALRSLEGLGCLELPTSRPTLRVIVGSQQIGRLKHYILAAGPELAMADGANQGERARDWWIRSWEPTYREIGRNDFRSVGELTAIVYDSGVQLGAGSLDRQTGSDERSLRSQSLASLAALESRIRTLTKVLVEELIQGWREVGGR
jgi:hypothetical protein